MTWSSQVKAEVGVAELRPMSRAAKALVGGELCTPMLELFVYFLTPSSLPHTAPWADFNLDQNLEAGMGLSLDTASKQKFFSGSSFQVWCTILSSVHEAMGHEEEACGDRHFFSGEAMSLFHPYLNVTIHSLLPGTEVVQTVGHCRIPWQA